jgi:hypothetical protein
LTKKGRSFKLTFACRTIWDACRSCNKEHNLLSRRLLGAFFYFEEEGDSRKCRVEDGKQRVIIAFSIKSPPLKPYNN